MLKPAEGTADRRQHLRLTTRIPLHYDVLGRMRSRPPELESCSESRDICLGGISFDALIEDSHLASALQKNRKFLKLQLMLDQEQSSIETRAGVAWMYGLKGLASRSTYGIGARFFGMSKAELQMLTEYLARGLEFREHEFAKRRDRVFRILSKIARVPVRSFAETTLIREELGFDSLMAVEALAAFETVFDIEIDETRAFELRTVGDILLLVEEYAAEKPERPAFALRLV
jgi:acyl carrier protein